MSIHGVHASHMMNRLMAPNLLPTFTLLPAFLFPPVSADPFLDPSTFGTMTIQMPRRDSSAGLTSTLSIPGLTQSTAPGSKNFHSSTTTSSATFQPTLTIPCGNPGPANGVKFDVGRHRSRWGWISRYPVGAILSIVMLLVLAMIILMILTLNGDVQPLYGQVPYNVTGVSPSGAADEPAFPRKNR